MKIKNIFQIVATVLFFGIILFSAFMVACLDALFVSDKTRT